MKENEGQLSRGEAPFMFSLVTFFFLSFFFF